MNEEWRKNNSLFLYIYYLTIPNGLDRTKIYQYIDQELVSPGILLDAGERRATDRRISSFYSPDVSLVVRTKKPKRRPNISLSEFDVSGGSSAGPSPIVEKVKADTQYIHMLGLFFLYMYMYKYLSVCLLNQLWSNVLETCQSVCRRFKKYFL